MIGTIRELSHQLVAQAPKLSFFFCQGTDAALNNATAVLRSLIWLLLIQQPDLMSHLLQKYNKSGASLFKDNHAFKALSGAFRDMLKDPRLSPVYFAVDALDECEQGLPGLIELISTSLTFSNRVRWLISSRPEVDILTRLKHSQTEGICSSETLLQLDAQRLCYPIKAFINYKLSDLKTSKVGYTYTDDILATMFGEIYQRAKDNFLWVSHVFSDLKSTHGKFAIKNIQKYPSGLSELYNHKMTRLQNEDPKHRQHCKDVLIATSLAYRPLSLNEFEALLPWSSAIDSYAIIEKCSSFLTITENTVALAHQSAKDYLMANYEPRLQSAGVAQGHVDLSMRCIEAMSLVLKQNMYLLDFGFKPKDVWPSEPDPLAPVQYSCVFWADHLCFLHDRSSESQTELMDDARVLRFLEERFFNWLESISLLGKLSDGTQSLRRLLHMIQVTMSLA